MNPVRLSGRGRLPLLVMVVLLASSFVSVGAASPPASFVADGLRVTPPTVNFGAVAQREIKERALSVTNIGSDPVTLGGWGVLEFGPFTFGSMGASDPDCPLSIPTPGAGALLLPGDTCTFTLIAKTFFPEGTYKGGFRVLSGTDETIVLVPLSLRIK